MRSYIEHLSHAVLMSRTNQLLSSLLVFVVLQLAMVFGRQRYPGTTWSLTNDYLLQTLRRCVSAVSDRLQSPRHTLVSLVAFAAVLILLVWASRQVYWATWGLVETRSTSCGRLARFRTLSSDTFSVTMKVSPWEKSDPRTYKHLLKGQADVEKMLKAQTMSCSISRPGNIIGHVDTAYVPCKGQGEDSWSFHVVSRRDLGLLQGGTGDKDESFWLRWARLVHLSERVGITRVNKNNDTSISEDQSHLPPINNLSRDGSEDITVCCMLDGHAGKEVSILLSRTLGAVLVNALANLGDGARDQDKVKEALELTIRDFSQDLLDVPNLFSSGAFDDLPLSKSLPSPNPVLLSLGAGDDAGSCVTALIIDQKFGKMYAINLGDCRAVAGWWNPETKMWRCDRLSEIGDMRGDNDYERARTRDEHADQEPDHVIIDRGDTHRLLGNCQLTRTLGDNKYNRDAEEARRLEHIFGFKYEAPYHAVVHPPYMSHRPEIIVRDLLPDNGEQLKFMILATDGLWDGISDEEAVLLTSAHIENSGPRTVSKKALPNLFPQGLASGPRPWPADDLPGATKRTEAGSWTFKEDDTPAVHLIRNAIGYGDSWLNRRFLSMELGITRAVRDDTTAMFLRFGKDN